jgi:hypothetical protein
MANYDRPHRPVSEPGRFHLTAHCAPSPITRMCSSCRQPRQTTGSRTFVIKGVRRFFCRACAEQRAILSNCHLRLHLKA